MAGERHSFTDNPVVIADEVKPSAFVPGRRKHGWEPVMLDVHGHPATMKVRHRRFGVCTINAADFDESVHEPVA